MLTKQNVNNDVTKLIRLLANVTIEAEGRRDIVSHCLIKKLTIMCESFPAASTPPANSRANPGHLKKLVKCLVLRAIFVGKYPTPRSYYDDQIPAPPSILIAIFSNKNNCFS